MVWSFKILSAATLQKWHKLKKLKEKAQMFVGKLCTEKITAIVKIEWL